MRVATIEGDVATSVSLIMLIIDYVQLKWSLWHSSNIWAIRLKDLCYKVLLAAHT